MSTFVLSSLLLIGLLQGPTAPDGRRGLGEESSGQDLQKLLRSDEEEESEEESSTSSLS